MTRTWTATVQTAKRMVTYLGRPVAVYEERAGWSVRPHDDKRVPRLNVGMINGVMCHW